MITLLHNTPDLVLAEKPPGLAVIPGRGETTSLLEQLAAQLKIPSAGAEDPRLRVVHRLDKDTSGVIAFAKHIDAQRALSEQFQNNTVEKEYLAVVRGNPTEDEGTIEARIGPHPTVKTRMHITKQGRPAITGWRVEKRLARGAATLIRCFPKTGKTHQIRIHLAHLGHPLLIDPIYNNDSAPVLLSAFKRNYRPNSGEERPLMSRLTLHAEKIRFLPPNATDRLQFTAEPPRDFRSLINQLSKL